MLGVAEFVTDHDAARLELAMHAWASRDEVVAKAVANVEKSRIEFARSLLKQIGFRGAELEMRTRTFLVFYGFEAAFGEELSKAERMRQVKLRHKMLIRKP